MKTILISLKKNHEKIKKLIVKREDIYYKRTGKWQNSEKGACYESDTIELDFIKDKLEEAITSLQEITGFYN